MSAGNDSIDAGERLPINIVRGTKGELVLFLVLNVWPSHFGLPIMLALVLSKRVKRHATFANLCAAFIIIGVSSSLLVYDSRTTGPEPGRMICLLQASLLYGMPALSSTAAFSLVLQMNFMVKAAYDGVPYLDGDHIIRLWIMLVGPYIVFFTSIIVTAVIGVANPQNVSRDRRFFYCSVESLALTNTITTFSAVVLMATLILMAYTLSLLYRRIRLARSHASRPRWTLDLNFPVRIMVFGLYVIVAFCLSVLSVTSPSSPVPDLVVASAATVAILIFGTQKDILHALCFWKKPPLGDVSEPGKAMNVNLKNAFDGVASDTESTVGRNLQRKGSNKPLPPPPYDTSPV
ncbi:hypothetical protein HYPSUDRAFT_162012 [Hypholoma sublateritium FD-334 SS-4]|uniref:G-protein coupled receptors family 1 profile domain-containing protein n=1 Tax=Hypholoma sublateritium (strain FD-334 SS-4) TaxID=945553 RepID=A0A0D2P183_HYPSF|nr:hypothetical protein HYPSUDRAFT_162012 [Hypholoma sublateritium FD-334 SS-4]